MTPLVGRTSGRTSGANCTGVIDCSIIFVWVRGVPLSDCSTNKFPKALDHPSHSFVYLYVLMFNAWCRGRVMTISRMRLICLIWHESVPHFLENNLIGRFDDDNYMNI